MKQTYEKKLTKLSERVTNFQNKSLDLDKLLSKIIKSLIRLRSIIIGWSICYYF